MYFVVLNSALLYALSHSEISRFFAHYIGHSRVVAHNKQICGESLEETHLPSYLRWGCGLFLQQEEPAASLKVVSTRPSTGGSRRPSARDNQRAIFSMGHSGRKAGMKVPTTVSPCVGRRKGGFYLWFIIWGVLFGVMQQQFVRGV